MDVVPVFGAELGKGDGVFQGKVAGLVPQALEVLHGADAREGGEGERDARIAGMRGAGRGKLDGVHGIGGAHEGAFGHSRPRDRRSRGDVVRRPHARQDGRALHRPPDAVHGGGAHARVVPMASRTDGDLHVGSGIDDVRGRVGGPEMTVEIDVVGGHQLATFRRDDRPAEIDLVHQGRLPGHVDRCIDVQRRGRAFVADARGVRRERRRGPEPNGAAAQVNRRELADVKLADVDASIGDGNVACALGGEGRRL